jgi:hypothetical protein
MEDARDQHARRTDHHCRMELDTHADTSAFGSDCYVVQETGKTVSVGGFDTTLGEIAEAAVATVAVAYDCPTTFRTYILFFHQALYVASMTTHLVSPFQMRSFGVMVKDVPLQHIPEELRAPDAHTIAVLDKNLVIPLKLKGTMSGCTVRKPTLDEVQDSEQMNVTHVVLTDESVWNPSDPIHKKHEKALRRFYTEDSTLRLHEPRELSTLHAKASDSGDSLDSGDLSAFDFCQPYVPHVKSILRSSTKVKFADPIAEVMVYNQRMPANTPFTSM